MTLHVEYEYNELCLVYRHAGRLKVGWAKLRAEGVNGVLWPVELLRRSELKVFVWSDNALYEFPIDWHHWNVSLLGIPKHTTYTSARDWAV